MAGNISNYLENKILEHTLGKTAYTMPSVFVALYTADPGEGGLGTEVGTGLGYVRKPVTFGAAANGSISNSLDVVFDTSTGAWGTVGFVALTDASTGGNVLWYGPLSASKTVASGDSFKIATGALIVSID